jgi:hypothetical protein
MACLSFIAMMMNRQLLTLFLSMSVCVCTQAQFTGHYNALNIAGSQNTLKTSVPLAEPAVVGSTYVDDEWQTAELLLQNGTRIPDLSIRIEIEHGNIEIDYNGQIKYLNLKGADSLKLQSGTKHDALVVRLAAEFTTHEGTPLKGVVILYPGPKYSLAKNYYIEFRASNYNVAMDIGSREHRNLKKERLFLSRGDTLIDVSGSNKKIAGRMGSDASNVLAIAKEKKLKLSREADLKTLVSLLR